MGTARPRGARARRSLVLAAALAAAACGGGGSSGSAATGSGIGNLSVLSHAPAALALQVPVDARFEIAFDGVIDGEALNEEHFTLTPLDQPEAAPIACTFTTAEGGRVVLGQPQAPLAKATDYRLRLQPALCDTTFRTLDRTIDIDFRTFDDVPPRVVATSIANHQTGVARRLAITVTLDEALDASSVAAPAVHLKDLWGRGLELTTTVEGSRLVIAPLQDLPGSTQFVLTLRGGQGGVGDRAGNPLAANHGLRFTTETDTTPPRLVASDPENNAQGVSPRARIAFRFDESMDETSYEPSALRLVDSFLNPVSFALTASPDRRTLILQPKSPLRPGETYSVRLRSGPTALTDVSGVGLVEDIERTFITGSDDRGPAVASSLPASAARGVSPNVVLAVTLDEPVRAASVGPASVSLWDGARRVPASVTLGPGGLLVSVRPEALLTAARTYTLRLRGGWDGLLDLPGNPMDSDQTLDFTTSNSSNLPAFAITPSDGSTAVATTSRVVVLASEPLLASSVDSTTVSVKDADGDTVPGTLAVERRRAIVFRPSAGLPSGERLRVRVVGGPDGVRAESGNWATADTLAGFQVGFHADALAPELELTVNRIPRTHRHGLALPRFGFTIDTNAYDPGQPLVDPSSLVLTLSGPFAVPSPDDLFARTVFDGGDSATHLDATLALAPGRYVLTAACRDLSGNPAPVATLEVDVDDATLERRPFERGQLVWVQFDTDREGRGRGDGVADFDQDLLALGLLAAGDPIGRNAWLRKTVADGILAVANDLFVRAADGTPRQGSVAVRLVARQPSRAAHMRMAVGGFDPEGRAGRKFGEASTGILGRAFFDYRNAVPNENNAGTSPGLGVFLGELWLYQARLYLDLWPHYLTSFGRTFQGLSPHMGGKPAGTHPLDAVVLAADFVYDKATVEQRARWDQVMNAADDIASAIGVILAHEIGHSIGLVAEGKPSRGLHGDASLHNATTGISDVMGAVVSYDSLIHVEFAFRPLNLAYLRERILVK